MLRELNLQEMMLVSGGTQLGDEDHDPKNWEEAWAMQDPLVMSQMLGGAGYGGDVQFGGTGQYVTDSGGGSMSFSWGSGDVAIQCCDDARINIDADFFEANFNAFELIEAYLISLGSSGVTSANGYAVYTGDPNEPKIESLGGTGGGGW